MPLGTDQNPDTDDLDPSRIRWLDVDGIRTRYYEAGSGEPIVLLHGGEYGSLYSLSDWSLNLQFLARFFHVYALDRLGQGHTDNPADQRLDLESVLQHTRRFFELAGIRQAHVVGHSRGALLATWLQQHFPALVRTLVLVDTRSTAPPNAEHRNEVLAENTRIRQRLLNGEITIESVRAEAEVQSYRPAGLTTAFVDRMLEIALLPKTREAQVNLEAVRRSSWAPSLSLLREDVLARIDVHGLSVPTLLLWGFNDRSAPVTMAYDLLTRIAVRTSRAELHVINQARHYSFRDQPDAFNRAVVSFCGT